MPLYDYACPTCKCEFERLRSMADGESASCPDCGTVAHRTLSLVAARVGGSGGEFESSGMSCGCGSACACCS